MNLRSIADAIATQYAGITAANGGTTETLVLCTASLPNTIPAGASLLVYPPFTEDHEIGVSAIRQGHLIYMARLLRDPLDVPARTDWLYAWAAAMQDRVEQNLDLGLAAYVAEAEVTGFRVAVDGQQYAGSPFDVVEHEVTVTLYEQSVTVGV
jgi:hypothetical protein